VHIFAALYSHAGAFAGRLSARAAALHTTEVEQTDRNLAR